MATEPPTKRERQRLATRSQILDAARRTMQELGFRATTIRAIAGAAGVATGTVMSHCGSKEDLLYEVFHRDIDAIADEVFDSLPEGAIDEQLVHIATTFVRRYADEPALNTDFLEHALLARGVWGERFTEQATRVGMRIGGLFSAAIQRGEIPATVDVRTTVTTFFSIYYFVLIGQIKLRFTQVEAATEQLRTQIEHSCRGALA